MKRIDCKVSIVDDLRGIKSADNQSECIEIMKGILS